MGLRETLQQRKSLGPAVAVVLLLVAGVVAWTNMAGERVSTVGSEVWYFDPASKSLVVMPSGDAPANRPELVRARVFSAGSCQDESQRLVYLEKKPPRKQLDPAVENRAASARNRPEDAEDGSRVPSRLVAAQDSPDQWLDAESPEGRSIVEFAGKAPAGAKLTECYPNSK
jgi:hypothetical protein